jgi:peptidoglycan/xylan/chitin deacetylase (PgdA/CDA1 family)
MKKILSFAALILLSCTSASGAPSTPWHGHKAAIALTYDDSLHSQLDIAVPQLDAAGLKGTFFLMGRQVGDQVPRWKEVAAHGHELGNHSVNHPCAKGSYDMPEQYTSEAYNVSVFLTDVGVMNGFLQALDGKPAHAFATPCDQHTVGGQDYLAPMQQAHAATFIRDQRTMPNSIAYTGFVDKSGADMIAWVEGVVRDGKGGVIVFHGVGGDYLNVSGEAHRQLVEYLKSHEKEIWTTTFSNVLSAANTH